MVIVHLVGGLGNQMFQYALGRRLSILHRVALKLDITGFGSYKLRRYSLKPFCIREAFATREEVASIKGTSQRGLARFAFRARRKLEREFLPYYRRSVIRETSIRPFDANIMKAPKNVYLQGYWQTQKYFIEIEDVIRREFTIRYEQDHESRELARQIADAQSVSIHVRRGDYVSDPRTRRTHGVCSVEYYNKCVSLVAERAAHPQFFVFSDDPDWAMNHLHLDHPTTFVTHNDASKDYEDLRLMSMCKHHIIANSSFSWWGAWLCANPGKIVMAPQKWFKDPTRDTRDLIPDSWYRI